MDLPTVLQMLQSRTHESSPRNYAAAHETQSSPPFVPHGNADPSRIDPRMMHLRNSGAAIAPSNDAYNLDLLQRYLGGGSMADSPALLSNNANGNVYNSSLDCVQLQYQYHQLQQQQQQQQQLQQQQQQLHSLQQQQLTTSTLATISASLATAPLEQQLQFWSDIKMHFPDLFQAFLYENNPDRNPPSFPLLNNDSARESFASSQSHDLDVVDASQNDTAATRSTEKATPMVYKECDSPTSLLKPTSLDSPSKSVKKATPTTARRFLYGSEPFPVKLYRLLVEAEERNQDHIVSFTPSGKAFAIHCPVTFMDEIAPLYFKTRNITSFKRQLYLYSFCRVVEGSITEAFANEYFQRDRLDLLPRIKRSKTTSQASSSSSTSFPALQD
jgi:type II secretory pathway pseudopilin PulG